MNKLSLALLASAAALAIAPAAMASPITGEIYVYGNDSFTSTSITVDSPAYIGNGTLGTLSPTGSFGAVSSPALAGTAVTIASFGGSLPQLFLTGDDGLTFTLDSYSILTQSSTFWNIVGTGTFALNGYDPTLYNFSFTTTNSAGNGDTVEFSANAVATPEPSSLLLLGTGLLGLAFVAFRKAKSSSMALSM